MQQQRPLEQIEMHGVYLAGNPANRPRGTASLCRDFRVMPGWWLRLRGGRKARRYLGSGVQVMQIHQFRSLTEYGADSQLIQLKYSPTDVRWSWFSLLTYTPDPYAIESIDLARWTTPRDACAPVTNLPDRPVFWNGQGVRGGSDSKPPFSSYYGGVLRYFGLDAYCVGGNPTVAFVAGTGKNTVQTAVQIWCGLHSISTDHYSNAVYCGEIGSTSEALGVITVSNLSRLKYATHGFSETSDLEYVFYATIDGGAVPYLVMGDSGTFSVPVSSSSASLSLVSGTVNGWVLDLTHAAPTANHPPRPMRSICFANGRLYGVPINAGSGNAVMQTFPGGYTGLDFTYQVTSPLELAGVVWSSAPGDSSRGGALGDPWQCWPLTNSATTPNGDQPLAVFPAPDNVRVCVFTARRMFVLVEAADGVHEFEQIDFPHGLSRAETICRTPYGVVWVTHRRQVALFDGEAVRILSGAYQQLLANSPARCADYLQDPIHEIDSYRVYLEDGTCVVHDFALDGEAYTETGQQYTAVRTLVDGSGKNHHVVANTGLYTQEAQPETGEVLTLVQTFTGTDQAYTSALPPDGRYERNWDEAGDITRRKEIDRVDILGDGDSAAVLWRKDFSQDEDSAVRQNGDGKAPQSRTDGLWSFRMRNGSGFWHKFIITMAPSVAAAPANHTRPALEGDQAANFWGSVMRLLLHFSNSENRQ